jgi:hypothetical protein
MVDVKVGDKDFPSRNFVKGMIPDEKDSFKSEDFEAYKAESERVARMILDSKHDFLDFTFFDWARQFCVNASSGMMPHFHHKKDFFDRKIGQLDDAKRYKFADEFIQLHIEKTRSEIIYKHLPFRNMWLECKLPIGDITVTGIHMMKVKVNDKNQQVYDDDLFVPLGFDKNDISVFITGFDSKVVMFYDYFTFDKALIDEAGRTSLFVCPFCSTPVRKLENKKYYCDNIVCVNSYQKDSPIIYDVSKDIARKALTNITDVHKAEDKVRNFIANLLDFIMMREVHQHVVFTDDELQERNDKRARRGKKPLSNFTVIKVTGSIERYITLLKSKFNNDSVRARNEMDVSGHYFRFWKREKWCRLYEYIAKCSGDEEIRSKLVRFVRCDEDGLPLPDENQYVWDYVNKCIMVYVNETTRNKGLGHKKIIVRMISDA